MPDWNRIVTEHFDVAFDSSEFALVLNPPATVEQIVSLENELAFNFPEEWRDLYHAMDGFCVKPRGSADSSFNLLPPLASIPQLVETVRVAVADTHPEVADDFIPAMDFSNGDFVGYLKSDASKRLHMFNHECFRYVAEQETSEFLFPIEAETIEELLGC